MVAMSSGDVSRITDGKGWLLFNDSSVADGELAAMDRIAREFGIPSERDGGALWPIVPRSAHGTFSETNTEALFHTDAQYHREPEPYFLLFCVTPAACACTTMRCVAVSM